MEENNVIDNLEGLWFFSNVLHSPFLNKHIQLHFCNEDINLENGEKIETPSEPIVIQQPHKTISSVEIGKSEVSRSRNEKENEEDIVKLHTVDTTLASALSAHKSTPAASVLSYRVHKSTMADVEERKRRKLSKKRNKKIVNVGDYDEDMGFDFNFDLSEFWYERLKLENESKRKMMMMPPLSDGMAMKQHLKSWAYAVACNVR